VFEGVVAPSVDKKKTATLIKQHLKSRSNRGTSADIDGEYNRREQEGEEMALEFEITY